MSIGARLTALIAAAHAQNPDRIPLIGVSGAQGCGKSFQCRQFVSVHTHVAHFSLDDVYLSQAERTALAQRLHPLFATRGPPGTHNLGLAEATFGALRRATAETQTPLPRFDKARDDTAPEQSWPCFRGRPEAILFDGWCLGAMPDEPGAAPLNALERSEDPSGQWRAAVREALAGPYSRLFARCDAILYLQAPGWDTVKRWRAEQEAETLGRPLTAADLARLDRFMQHYERLTKSMMAGRHTARHVIALDDHRAAMV